MVESEKKQQSHDLQKSDFLSSSRIAIFGLGLMGGSLAMALRGKCKKIYGYDPNLETLDAVINKKLADHVSAYPDEMLHNSDLVILAAPVLSIIKLIKKMPEIHNGCAVILDIGSTKKGIVDAFETLPPRFDPIGGHPICGKDKSSIVYAENNLYLNAPFCLTKMDRTSVKACRLAEELVVRVGAIPVWVEADVHDKLIASTSHLPYLTAITLALSTPPDSSILIGPGFRDTGRLAGSDINMMLDILVTNRTNILETMDQYGNHFQKIKDILEKEDYSELRKIITAAAQTFSEMKKR